MMKELPYTGVLLVGFSACLKINGALTMRFECPSLYICRTCAVFAPRLKMMTQIWRANELKGFSTINEHTWTWKLQLWGTAPLNEVLLGNNFNNEHLTQGALNNTLNKKKEPTPYMDVIVWLYSTSCDLVFTEVFGGNSKLIYSGAPKL